MNGPGLEWLKAAIRTRYEASTLPIATNPPITSSGSSTSPAKPSEYPTPDPVKPREVPAAPLPALTLDTITGSTTTASAESSSSKTPDASSHTKTIAVAAPAPKSEAKLADPMPAELPLPTASSTPAITEPTSPRITDPEVAPASQPVTGVRNWNDLRKRMRELGVSRYEVEGEPGGKSRFRCLIPLAGRRAVGQQFEGEGDDDFQAAEAALRRVALWKATEQMPH